MDASEVVDLDSLIDLIDEDDFENDLDIKKPEDHSPKHEKTIKPNVVDLDSLIDLIDEDDFENDLDIKKPEDHSPKHEKTIKPNASTASLFPSAAKKVEQSHFSQNGNNSLVHTGDTSSDEEEKEYLTETGQQIKKKISSKSYHDRFEKKEPSDKTWVKRSIADSISKEKPCAIDNLSGIRIIKPLISSDVMKMRMQGRKVIKMSFMKDFIKGKDIEGDWVTLGVVVNKIPPKTSKNGKLFSIWKLSDLLNTEKIVSLFLFGTVHNEHWKTSVGTVIGLLNPSFLDNKDRGDFATITIDHPGKLMLIGTSKDFGLCKSKRKDGSQCTSIVNMSQCQYCTYHVTSEYKKFSKRSEIQSSYSSRGLTMKEKVLKGQNFFYAGQTFSPLGKPEKKSKKINSKDKLTLSNLGLKRKAATVFNEEKAKSAKKVTEMYGEEISKVAQNNSEFINNQLLLPSAGSKHLLQHMLQKTSKDKNMSMINAKDLMKQHVHQMNALFPSKKKDDSTILRNLIPVLGKGLSPGQTVNLDICSHPNSKAAEHYSKLRAIQKIKEIGPITKKNPNCVKSKPEPQKIKAALESSFEEKSVDDKTPETKETVLRSKLGVIDLNSEKIQSILNRKSSHAYEVEMAEMEREAAYFDRLEKKEMMEEKMTSTKEIVCDVVSCKQCRYTAQNAADRCKNENHPLKCHKAIKRFFACKDCNHRTDCFSRFPHKSCRLCGGSRFERTGMKRVRLGPKLDSEMLSITAEDAYFSNSL